MNMPVVKPLNVRFDLWGALLTPADSKTVVKTVTAATEVDGVALTDNDTE